MGTPIFPHMLHKPERLGYGLEIHRVTRSDEMMPMQSFGENMSPSLSRQACCNYGVGRAIPTLMAAALLISGVSESTQPEVNLRVKNCLL